MPVVATHSGPFHADDVLAFALLKTLWRSDLTLVRTREPAELAPADVVFDVGGTFDMATCRFDHHQSSYKGDRSSAGMVLDWLEAEGTVSPALAKVLRHRLVDYVDAVDNGRRAPVDSVPCFSSMVEQLTHTAATMEGFDAQFLVAAQLASSLVQGIVAGHEQVEAAREAVLSAMATAVANNTRVIALDAYYKWKSVYFNNGGETHPTDFVLFPSSDGSWRIVAIPPVFGDFGQKRSLPAEWAGLSGEALESVTGIPGSMFCHKNRFIAVFRTHEAALQAIDQYGLDHRPS